MKQSVRNARGETRDVLRNKYPPNDGTPPACNVTPNATTTPTVAPTTNTTYGASAAGTVRLCPVFTPAAGTSKTDLTECEQVLKGGGNVKGCSLAILNDIYAEPSDDGNLV